MDRDSCPSKLVNMSILGLIVLGMVGHLAWAADPEIAVREIAGNRYNLTVMEADGSNPTQLIVKRPNSGRHAYLPSWSPGGDWIAFRDRDANGADAIFKIPGNGGEPTLVLCGSGTGRDLEYDSLDFVRWSPDGQWLLVRASKASGEYWLAVISATEEEDGDCTSDLATIYYVGWDGLDGEGWWSWNGPTWNGDGSKIGIFEFYERDGLVVGWRLQILHVDYASGEPRVVDNSPILLADQNQPIAPSLAGVNLESSGSNPDWQRQSGSLLTFDLWEGLEPWLCWIDTETDAWGYLIEGVFASWSPDNSRIVFTTSSPNGADLVLADVSYAGNNVLSLVTPRKIGEGYFPDWKRAPLSQTCSVDADCDDGKDCTDNVCNGGVCLTSNNTAECDDGNPCTNPDVCSNGSCRGTAIDNGSGGNCALCCAGECFDPANSCEPEPVDCAGTYFDKKSCNADILCRWDNRNGVCIDN